MNDELKDGLVEIRKLVDSTHWTQSSYIRVEYDEGDGLYADGALVKDAKVVGCLVGLARLVGAKWPTYVDLFKGDPVEMPIPNLLSNELEREIKETIMLEFSSDEYMYFEGEDDDPDQAEDGPPEHSIEAWNDRDVRTREHVLAMLDRTIERVSMQEASA